MFGTPGAGTLTGPESANSRCGRIALAIFRLPLTQVALGVVAGACLSGLLSYGIPGGAFWPSGALLLVMYAVPMMAVCMLACIVPTRRALRIEPTEALRADV